ncbi:MAG: glycoside hydrolase family 25 protein [Ruminococcus sp.]|nr:glycoside hydrolase family 25 protein [Ruminococcus sp.]
MKKLILSLLLVLTVVFAVSCKDKAVSTQAENITEVETEPETQTPTEKRVQKIHGIDVSSFSGAIDWSKVKNDNIDFAIIRIGGRGYGESGSLYEDKLALENIDSAQKNGIKTGGYFFSQATSKAEAKEEAEFVVNLLGERKLEFPIAYDVEHIKNDSARVDDVAYSDSVKFAKVFLDEIKKSGYEPMVYVGEDSILKAEDFKDYKIWYADYKKPYESGYEILQYSTNGKINGISRDVDLDIMYE